MGRRLLRLALLEKLVNINSGTMNLPGVVAVKDVVAPQIEALGFKVQWTADGECDWTGGGSGGGASLSVQGRKKCGKRLLLIGHMDTVFEPSSSFQKYSIVPGTNGNVATGPGVNDMKGGLVVMLTALKAMKAAGTLDNAEITIVLSGDEERHGEPTSLSRERHDRGWRSGAMWRWSLRTARGSMGRTWCGLLGGARLHGSWRRRD